MRAGEVKEIEDGVAEYLLSTFPNNFEEQLETNENGLEGSPKEDDGQEPSEPELEEPAPTEVKQVAKSKRTNQRKRSTKLPKTKLFK